MLGKSEDFGTAVSERRTTMTKFIEAKKKNHGWI